MRKALGTPLGRTVIGYTVATAVVATLIAVGPIPGYVALAGLIAFAVRGTANLLNLRFPNLPRWAKTGLAALVAVSWLVNLTLHLPAAFATGGLPALINGLFAAADALFLVAALPTALHLLVKARKPDNQATRWAEWLAFPTITLAAGLLGYQLGFVTGPWFAALPIATLTVGFVYLTQTKLAASPFGTKHMSAWTWWSGSRVVPGALVTANISLAGYGLLRLWTEHHDTAIPTTIALAVTTMGLWAINPRGPNPPATRVRAVGIGLAAVVFVALWPGLLPWALNLAGLGAGAVVGLVIGVFGAGGALVTIPALSFGFGQSPVHAATGSLVIVGATALINTVHGLVKKDLDWRTGALLGLAGFGPAILGGLLAARLNPNGPALALAALMGVAALKTWSGSNTTGGATSVTGLPRLVRVAVIGLGAGFLTGMLGIGGAFLIIPALVLAKVTDFKTAGATVVMVTAINSISGLSSRLGELATLDWKLIGPFAVAAVLTGLIGKQIKNKLPMTVLQRGFAGFLFGVAGLTAYQALTALTASRLTAGIGTALLMAGFVATNAIRAHRGSKGSGGPVADGVPSDTARRTMTELVHGLLTRSRVLDGTEFPNLARGPPALTRLVRITDSRPLDGKLVAFGWRPDGTSPADGVILVPAHVAALVERLIDADPSFASWWADLLRHEWTFHIDGHTHTGARHDRSSDRLVARLRAAQRALLIAELTPILRGDASPSPGTRLLLPVAFDQGGTPVTFEPPVIAAVSELVARLREQGRTPTNSDHLAKASPSGLWSAQGTSYRLLLGDAELHELLAAARLGTTTVVYLLDPADNAVLVTLRTGGDILDRSDTQPARDVLEHVVARWLREPDTTVENLWADRQPATVTARLLLGVAGTAETALDSWGEVVEGLERDGAAADPADADRAGANLDRAGVLLDRIARFLGDSGTAEDAALGELRVRLAAAHEQLGSLRARFASVTEALRRYSGLDDEERDIARHAEETAEYYQMMLEDLTSDSPAGRAEQLGELLDREPGPGAEELAAAFDELTELPQTSLVLTLSVATDRLRREYQQMHDAVHPEEQNTTHRAVIDHARSVVRDYREYLDWLTGADPATRAAQLGELLDLEPGPLAVELTGLLDELATLPPTTAIAELVEAADRLRAEYQLMHDATDVDGGTVADGVDSAVARMALLPQRRRLAEGSRPLDRGEFPHLARGPPELVALVRITDEEPLDGKLIGFSWRDGDGTSVILVPARVAALVNRLIDADPTFLEWWLDLLRHEWEFHLDGDEHTGHRHDRHAAALVTRLRAAEGLPAPRPVLLFRALREGESEAGVSRAGMDADVQPWQHLLADPRSPWISVTREIDIMYYRYGEGGSHTDGGAQGYLMIDRERLTTDVVDIADGVRIPAHVREFMPDLGDWGFNSREVLVKWSIGPESVVRYWPAGTSYPEMLSDIHRRYGRGAVVDQAWAVISQLAEGITQGDRLSVDQVTGPLLAVGALPDLAGMNSRLGRMEQRWAVDQLLTVASWLAARADRSGGPVTELFDEPVEHLVDDAFRLLIAPHQSSSVPTGRWDEQLVVTAAHWHLHRLERLLALGTSSTEAHRLLLAEGRTILRAVWVLTWRKPGPLADRAAALQQRLDESERSSRDDDDPGATGGHPDAANSDGAASGSADEAGTGHETGAEFRAERPSGSWERWRKLLRGLWPSVVAAQVIAAPPALAAEPGSASGGGPVLVVVAAGVVVVLTHRWVRGVLTGARGKIVAWFGRLIGAAGRVGAGVGTGFVLAALVAHPLAVGLVLWGGLVLAGGDLLLRLLPVEFARELGKAWTERGPPAPRLFGVGTALGAFWWLHTSAPDAQAVALVAPVVAVVGISVLIHGRALLLGWARQVFVLLAKATVEQWAIAGLGVVAAMVAGWPVAAGAFVVLLGGRLTRHLVRAEHPALGVTLWLIAEYRLPLFLGALTGTPF
ncbi:sulfite exporter TauE/SafE family protein [Pseudonocardia spinosispora]|uniref:sulfite exporter TauE/SafE family protein n=1 Tax=Pseudonocardia spinosispora TaxID=103441 RepID=UPI001B7FD7DD|nr:sulfite exporter TauE/SafE family protein [Pseudonocardia spinosispora]